MTKDNTNLTGSSDLPDIYYSNPIPIEDTTVFIKRGFLYELWWFIKGGHRKQQISRIKRFFGFKSKDVIITKKNTKPINLVDLL